MFCQTAGSMVKNELSIIRECDSEIKSSDRVAFVCSVNWQNCYINLLHVTDTRDVLVSLEPFSFKYAYLLCVMYLKKFW